MERFWIYSFLFVHFVGWANVPASGGGLFRHLLHLTLLAAVDIFWLNDAWKWISIFCDQKCYVMAVRYMHYKQPGCLWKWKCRMVSVPQREECALSGFLLWVRLGQHTVFKSPVSYTLFCPVHQLCPTISSAFPYKESWNGRSISSTQPTLTIKVSQEMEGEKCEIFVHISSLIQE